MDKNVKMVPIPGSEKQPIAKAKKIKKAPEQEMVHAVVRVRRKGPDLSADLANAIKGQHLTIEQYEQKYASSDEDMKKVEDYIKANGISVVQVDRGRRSVEIAGTVQNIENAFKTVLDVYEHDNYTFRGRTGPLHVPSELKDIVTGVFGLDNRPFIHPHYKQGKMHAKAGATRKDFPTAFTPPELAKLYDFPSAKNASLNGSGQCVGILELGGGYRPLDFKSYCAEIGLPAAPQLTEVKVGSGHNNPGSDADGEVMLDIEIVAGVVPGAKIAVYFAPNDNRGLGFINALTTAVHDKVNRPSVISISWGGSEDDSSISYKNSFNETLQTAAILGITVLVASGDNGAADKTPSEWDGKAHVDFPSSSQYVLSVGGTKLVASANKISSETVWNQFFNDKANDSFGASGGGISTFEKVPPYQTQVNTIDNVNSGNPGRGVPDVAAVADPDTGYYVRVDGENTVIGGTSGAAPLWAGLIAQINQQLNTKVGWINQMIYVSSAQAFNKDITGNNRVALSQTDNAVGYRVSDGTLGWNPCVGLGSPKGTEVSKLLAAALKLAPATANKAPH